MCNSLFHPFSIATYINEKVKKLRFSLCLDIINYCDINIIGFYNHQDTSYIINIYSNNNQIALYVLCDNIRGLSKTLVMTRDFNIKDSDWDPNYYHYSIHTKDLLTIADSLGLELSPSSNLRPMRYANNYCNINLVLNLVFLGPDDPGFSRHSLLLELHKPSDHMPLTINVGINEENIDIAITFIKKDSNKERDFISNIQDKLNTSAYQTLITKLYYKKLLIGSFLYMKMHGPSTPR